MIHILCICTKKYELISRSFEFCLGYMHLYISKSSCHVLTYFRGTIKEAERLLLGPDEDGHFHKVKVGSIHRNRLPSRVATAGQTVSLCIGNFDKCSVRKVGTLIIC